MVSRTRTRTPARRRLPRGPMRRAPQVRPPAPVGSHALRRDLFTSGDFLTLSSGQQLGPVTVTYETHGRLDPGRSNAVYICHALTGDAHVARFHDSDRPGWWDTMVGPGRPIDTNRYFVICANVLGGCAGTTGPWSRYTDGLPYGLRFPVISVKDITQVHRSLVAELGVKRLRAVIGGSLGAMQSLQWFLDAPKEACTFLVVAGSSKLSAENLAWNAIGRAAIRHDLSHGDRNGGGSPPGNGLGLARMVAHLTYLSEASLEAKFGRQRQEREGEETSHPAQFGAFSVERYLEHQAVSLVERFDALSYLYLTLAMDEFQPFQDQPHEDLAAAGSRVAIYSFSSDRLFGTNHSEIISNELTLRGASVNHYIDDSETVGHDAFLLESPWFLDQVRSHLEEVTPLVMRP